tara:strand:- start:255 stop:521 length:267 start_codon:yes stop_codon:yes gene_type:complete
LKSSRSWSRLWLQPEVPEVVSPPVVQAQAPQLNLAPIYFATGSARGGPNGRSLIAEIVKTIEEQEIVLLEVRGYADTRGSRGRNLRLR